jgi:hypothetical protein
MAGVHPSFIMSSSIKIIVGIAAAMAVGFGVKQAVEKQEKRQDVSRRVDEVLREGAEAAGKDLEKDSFVSPATSAEAIEAQRRR